MTSIAVRTEKQLVLKIQSKSAEVIQAVPQAAQLTLLLPPIESALNLHYRLDLLVCGVEWGCLENDLKNFSASAVNFENELLHSICHYRGQ